MRALLVVALAALLGLAAGLDLTIRDAHNCIPGSAITVTDQKVVGGAVVFYGEVAEPLACPAGHDHFAARVAVYLGFLHARDIDFAIPCPLNPGPAKISFPTDSFEGAPGGTYHLQAHLGSALCLTFTAHVG